MNISRYFIPCLNFEEGSNIQPDIKILLIDIVIPPINR